MEKRMERTAMLLGEESVEKLKGCHVAVFGIGGVGGHAVEALVRSGVGELTLVDNDEVAESNLNRQLIATLDTVGMAKTEAALLRIRAISPDCKVNLRRDFVLPENINSFPFEDYDYVFDAIDTVSGKLAIIKKCSETGTPCISAMGAGNKLDPTKFQVTDIYKTSVCPLCAVIRRECRRAGVKSLKVVYSTEPALTPAFQPEEDSQKKRRTPASSAFVPAVCGLVAAGEIIRDLVKPELEASLSERGKGGANE